MPGALEELSGNWWQFEPRAPSGLWISFRYQTTQAAGTSQDGLSSVWKPHQAVSLCSSGPRLRTAGRFTVVLQLGRIPSGSWASWGGRGAAAKAKREALPPLRGPWGLGLRLGGGVCSCGRNGACRQCQCRGGVLSRARPLAGLLLISSTALIPTLTEP